MTSRSVRLYSLYWRRSKINSLILGLRHSIDFHIATISHEIFTHCLLDVESHMEADEHICYIQELLVTRLQAISSSFSSKLLWTSRLQQGFPQKSWGNEIFLSFGSFLVTQNISLVDFLHTQASAVLMSFRIKWNAPACHTCQVVFHMSCSKKRKDNTKEIMAFFQPLC